MTENNNEPSDTPSLDQYIAPDQDWFLEELIHLANQNLSFPVTLYCGGLIVSGTLISGRTYFDETSALMKKAFGHQGASDAMSLWVDSIAASVYGSEREQEENQLRSTPGYIHLKGAQIFQSGQKPIPANEGVLWRARLSSIDAFNWGTLRAD